MSSELGKKLTLSEYAGTFPDSDPSIKLEGGTAALSCIKFPQDKLPGEIVLRLYEFGGRESHSVLYVKNAKHVWESNVVEKKGTKMSVKANKIMIKLKPYEIKTFRIEMARASSILKQ